MYYVSCYYFDNVRYILLYRWCIYTICEQARTSYTCYPTKQLCDDKTLHVSHKKVMLKSWTHFYICYPLALSWTLNISNLELLKHCLWISRLNFKHLRLNIHTSAERYGIHKKNELAKPRINYESRTIMWYKTPNFEWKKQAEFEKTHISGRTEKHLEHLEHLMSILAHLWEIESLYFAQIKYLGKCEHPMLKSIQWLQNNNNDGYYKVKNFRPYFFEYPKLKSISFDFKVEISYNHNNVSIPYL